jgi:hypothetical protein
MAMDFTTIWKAKALHAYVPPPLEQKHHLQENFRHGL